MVLTSTTTTNPKLLILEFGATALAVAVSFAWPQIGAGEKLLQYYRDRKAWLVEPDAVPVRMTPY
jgi:hypothetical protein